MQGLYRGCPRPGRKRYMSVSRNWHLSQMALLHHWFLRQLCQWIMHRYSQSIGLGGSLSHDLTGQCGLTLLLGGCFALSSFKTVMLSPRLAVLTSSWMDRISSFIAAFSLPLLISLAKDLARLPCLCDIVY